MSRNWTDPMQWDNTGVEPSSSLKQNGFTGGQKPPATVFNYLFNKIKTWVTELQGAVDDVESTKTGKNLAGKTVSPDGSSVTAGDGAEIFNDYRTRTQEGLIKSGNIASGSYSHAEGKGTTASGVSAHAEGAQTNATGINSHAEGGGTFASGNSAHTEGMFTQANGVSAHAEGGSTTASGAGSHAEGASTTAQGGASHAEGINTTAIGDYSHTEGKSSNSASSDYTNETANNTIITAWNTNKFTLAKGVASHAEGKDCLALGDNSHAEGNQTTASGEDSHAEGSGSTASGVSSHAEGASMARGDYSHSEGVQCTAIGVSAHVEGASDNQASSEYTAETANDSIISDWGTENFTLAKGAASHAEGLNVLALGDISHAEGNYTIASGNFSHAEGNVAKAKGQASHAEGQVTQANGIASHAGGHHTVAGNYQFVTGKYNTAYDGAPSQADQSANSTLFIIGNGIQNATSNAFRVTADGQCRGTKAFIGSGADFAEYFEWEDGNPNNEDRRGKFVTLNGEKIKLANDGDYILGIVSATGAFIGNSQSEEWQGKYLKDVYGDWLTQTIEVPESTDADTGEVVPAHTVTQYVVNPDFNPSEEYVSREFRKEWSPVGMLGQITLVDDGTCVVNGYCKPSANGVGTSADNGYRVLSRIDNSHVKVLVK